MDDALTLRSINKAFGKTQAVQGLNLSIPRGALYGFIGPNGAGKTTAIRMIMSILFPDSGTLSVLGCDTAFKARNRIGYLPEERGVYRKMRVGAFLSYMARLKGIEGDTESLVKAALERIELGHAQRKRCDELSKGMLQKVQFLAATIHKPDLLILDEPFSGLDPVSMRLLRTLILEEHRRGATILFSTHIMPQAEDTCEHVVMIHKGRKVLDASLMEIRNRYDPRTIRLEPMDPSSDVSSVGQIEGVETVRKATDGYEVLLKEGTDPTAAMRQILDKVKSTCIELRRPRLEDVFVEIVSSDESERTDAQSFSAGIEAEATA